MRKFLATLAAICVTAAIAYAAPLPLLPSTPQYNDPSATVATINALIQQLNGQLGYAPAAPVSIGASGTVSGGTPQTLNTQRGVVSFTGVGTLITGAVTTLVLNNSSVTTSSQCTAQVQSGGAAGSAPFVSTATPTAGVLTLILANGGTTATGAAATFAIAYACS